MLDFSEIIINTWKITKSTISWTESRISGVEESQLRQTGVADGRSAAGGGLLQPRLLEKVGHINPDCLI